MDTGTTAKVERAPLGRQIANVIRSDILFGRLKPGERVSQQQMCERYGTSRMPVRDALRQLTYEGFMVDDGSRHSVVASFSRADLNDIYLIEGMLHALAVRRVTERRDPDEVQELLDYHQAMLDAGGAGDSGRMAVLNYGFHRRINQLARSPKLLAVLRTHALSIPRDYIAQIPEWTTRANEQHAEIMEAVKAGRAATAERLMEKHVRDAGADLIDYLESHGVELA
jgi:DNA-binding GntR family transcriptional regulator